MNSRFEDAMLVLACMFAVGVATLCITIVLFVEERCIESGVVAAVGGCDRTGECGVRFEDGMYGRADYPLVGQAVCKKRANVWKE